MEKLHNLFKKIEPAKEKRVLHTTWDAVYTLFFATDHVTKVGSHIRDGMDIKRTMIHVVIALQLCLVFGMWNIGHQHYFAYGEYVGYFDGILQKLFFGIIQLLPIIIVVHVVGLGIEFVYAAKRGHGVEEGFLVTGMLIPLIVPPDIPLTQVALATAFAVVIGKEAFGGTGMNLLNVALLTRAFLFFAYPTYISGDASWIAMDTNWLHDLVGLGAEAKNYGYQIANEAGNMVANPELYKFFTGATPLGLAANPLEVSETLTLHGVDAVDRSYNIWQIAIGAIPGSVGETSAIACLNGALILLVTKIASWRIMLSMLIGCVVMAILFNIMATFPGIESPFLALPWYYHIFMGGFLFAMVFMATDPVTAAQTNQGKILYGFLIGVAGMIVRVLNPAYPEGWMLAILFMNVMAPLLDHVIVSRNIKTRLARG